MAGIKQKAGARRVRAQGRPRGEKNAVGRDGLIAATRDLLKSHRPSELSRTDIARLAGVDPGLIRYYFGNKDNLLLATTLQITAERGRRTAEAMQTVTTAKERFRAWIKVLVEVMAENPHYSQLLLEQIHYGTSAEARRIRRDLVATTYNELHGIVAAGEANGEFRVVDPNFLHLGLIGMCQFFFSRRPMLEELLGYRISADNMASLADAYVDFVADVLINGLDARAGKGG